MLKERLSRDDVVLVYRRQFDNVWEIKFKQDLESLSTLLDKLIKGCTKNLKFPIAITLWENRLGRLLVLMAYYYEQLQWNYYNVLDDWQEIYWKDKRKDKAHWPKLTTRIIPIRQDITLLEIRNCLTTLTAGLSAEDELDIDGQITKICSILRANATDATGDVLDLEKEDSASEHSILSQGFTDLLEQVREIFEFRFLPGLTQALLETTRLQRALVCVQATSNLLLLQRRVQKREAEEKRKKEEAIDLKILEEVEAERKKREMDNNNNVDPVEQSAVDPKEDVAEVTYPTEENTPDSQEHSCDDAALRICEENKTETIQHVVKTLKKNLSAYQQKQAWCRLISFFIHDSHSQIDWDQKKILVPSMLEAVALLVKNNDTNNPMQAIVKISEISKSDCLKTIEARKLAATVRICVLIYKLCDHTNATIINNAQSLISQVAKKIKKPKEDDTVQWPMKIEALFKLLHRIVERRSNIVYKKCVINSEEDAFLKIERCAAQRPLVCRLRYDV